MVVRGGMMTVKQWISASSTDWNTAGNWEPSGVPEDADDVYITSGSTNIAGFDASATELDSLTVGSKYTGTIGTSGTKLELDATTFNFSGSGDTYIEGIYGTLTIQDTSSSDTALNFSTSTIGITRILGGKGTINFASTCTLSTTIEQIGAEGVTVNIADGTTIGGSCTLTMDSGKLELNEAVTTITIYGGVTDIKLDSGTITTLNQYGGRVRWIPTASCTITTLNLYAGLFDSRDSTAPTYNITNCTIHQNGVLDERSGLENAVYVTAVNLESGEIRYDSGRQVTIT